MNNRKVFDNAKWIIACKTAQSLIQLIVGMLTARYLGPSNYGLINYAKSIVAFAIPFVQLGLDSTLIKELIDHPESEEKIMGTSLVLGILSGFIWVGLIGGFVAALNYTEIQTIIVCVLYGFSCVFQSITLIQYWFHSKLQAKIPAFIQLLSYVLVSALKVYLLIIEANVYWFTLVYSVEYALIGFSLLFIFRRRAQAKLEFSSSLAKQLLSRSFPYIWASFMVSVFQNIDHIMLKEMVGNEENGFYTAAVTVVSVCQYVYIAIVDAIRPVILAHKNNCVQEYRKSLAKLYGSITYLALMQGICFTLLSKYIVQIMYGAEYFKAVSVVKILVWYMPFACMGLIRNIWILAEGKQKCLWKINLAGVAVNVLANVALIPFFGAAGAAIASLITQCIMNFCLGFVFDTLKENNAILVMGLKPAFMLSAIRNEVAAFMAKRRHNMTQNAKEANGEKED